MSELVHMSDRVYLCYNMPLCSRNRSGGVKAEKIPLLDNMITKNKHNKYTKV
jgi:hypothetical protein